MGELGVPTRTAFPARGSCFTYGFLKSSTAPGQFSCDELITQLAATLPAYAEALAAKE